MNRLIFILIILILLVFASTIEAEHDDDKIPILMYHNISNGNGKFSISPEKFKDDLITLYVNGFCLVSIEDYLNGDFNIPPGRKPLVITFDDATIGQFSYIVESDTVVIDSDGYPKISPNCAVGIMLDFYKEHPDFGFKATFFIPFDKVPFQQKGMVSKKFNHLLDLGLSIGNHTYHHLRLENASEGQIKRELDLSFRTFEYYLGERASSIKVLAYPWGGIPKNTKGWEVIKNYEYKGNYLIASFCVWEGPAYHPESKYFDRWLIPRIDRADVKDISSLIKRWKNIYVNAPEGGYVNSDSIFHSTISIVTETSDNSELSLNVINDSSTKNTIENAVPEMYLSDAKFPFSISDRSFDTRDEAIKRIQTLRKFGISNCYLTAVYLNNKWRYKTLIGVYSSYDEANKFYKLLPSVKNVDNIPENIFVYPYGIQVGVFSDKISASKKAFSIGDLTYFSYLVKQSKTFSVMIGAFATRSDAEEFCNVYSKDIKLYNIKPVIVKR